MLPQVTGRQLRITFASVAVTDGSVAERTTMNNGGDYGRCWQGPPFRLSRLQ